MENILEDKVVISCQQLARTFQQGSVAVDVLCNVNLTIETGEKVAIVGASGSGKSTLLHLLGGLDNPTHGEVQVCGKSMTSLSDADRGLLRNEAMGFIYQFHHLLPEFTAQENVAMPLMIRGVHMASSLECAKSILERVGLVARLQHKPAALSGGERQRVAIARALITEPRAVLADEPTGNLDRKTADDVFQLMLRLNEEQQTSLVIVTHDPHIAARMDTIYGLQDGELYRQ